ncbi:hypothetical protein DFJ77DRAFT_278782 [Powellomyces hirtus]|nr:hypothetical protein DFJ77DRAFT_278782 [Powellomyces hirtus]
MDERHKASRAYRRQLPPEDQRELEGGFSENILFAAQALSCGFRIRGIEEYTQELYEPARQLHVAIEALRLAFCRRALGCPSPPYEDLFPVLRDFDRAWTAFEQKICFCYFSVTYSGRPGRSDDLDMFQVLMSETIIRAVRNSYITWAQVHAFDPLVMFAVPRLCIVAALHHMPDCIDVTDGEHGFRWFRSKASLLRRLQSELNLIGGAKIILLEKLLVDSDNHADEHADVDEGPAEMVVQESAEEEKEHHMMIPPAAEGKPVERTPSEIEPRESGETTELERAPSEIEPRESGETTELQPILYPGRSPSPLRRTFPLDQALVMAQSQKYDTLQLAQLSINGSGSAAARREFPLAPVRATLHELYVDICRVADDLQSGPQAREFVSILHKVFTMHQEEADAGPAAATNRAPAAAGMVAT